MRAGSVATIPDLPGRWSVWSKSDECPGAHFFVSANDAARAAGVKYAVVKVTKVRGSENPLLSVVRTETLKEGIAP